MIVPMNRNQRTAALLCNVDRIQGVKVTGSSPCYHLEWDADSTKEIVKRLKERTPDHDHVATPYRTLINRVIIMHRNTVPKSEV